MNYKYYKENMSYLRTSYRRTYITGKCVLLENMSYGSTFFLENMILRIICLTVRYFFLEDMSYWMSLFINY